MSVLVVLGMAALLSAGISAPSPAQTRRWLVGDHHIHSRFSTGYDTSTSPPTPIIGGDAIHPIPRNAEMALRYGLSWMVSTDHGGPHHSKVNLQQAYPELLRSRTTVPGLIQFFGMELDTPGGEHSSLIIPHSEHEHNTLFDLESRFSRRDAFPPDPSRDTEARMLEALSYMAQLARPPVVIANHPSRTATGLGAYGAYTPRELRDWNNTAPRVAVGMEGTPGHQASAVRGGYRRYPTLGGFDQMTARLGGFWDSMLAEGRRWWITSTSDAHRNWRDGGDDFWPGEYSKTYVFAEKNYQDILDGLRSGRVFVTTGDLVSELHVTSSTGGTRAARASIGGTLNVRAGDDVRVTIRVRDPSTPNHQGDNPRVARVDLIIGEITGPATDCMQDSNRTTRVAKRFTASDWKRNGEFLTMEYTLPDVHHSSYVRVRGTNTAQLEPEVDPAGEDPWRDLWFYSNPIFLQVR